jgi:tetratricopeptide (TPR) repeat protein
MSLRLERPIFKIHTMLLLFAFGLWIGQDLFMPRRLFGQTTAEDFLKKGKGYWEKFEENEAIAALDKALELGLAKPEDKIEAHLILAKCWAMKRDQEEAKRHFLEILRINPAYELSVTESPVYVEPFHKAKAEFTASNRTLPIVVHEPVLSAIEQEAVKITAKVTDASKIFEFVLYYKNRSDSDYSREEMKHEPGNVYMAAIPAEKVRPQAIQYYLSAKDASGNSLELKGSAENPYNIFVSAIEKTPPEITYEPPAEIQSGQDLDVTATIKDNGKVKVAVVRFKPKDTLNYQTIGMQQERANIFKASIASKWIQPPQLYYYIQAEDSSKNIGLWRNADHPYILKVSPKTVLKISSVAASSEKGKKAEKKKRKKTLLWIGLGTVVVGGVIAAVAGGGGKKGSGTTTPPILTDPPPWP